MLFSVFGKYSQRSENVEKGHFMSLEDAIDFKFHLFKGVYLS